MGKRRKDKTGGERMSKRNGIIGTIERTTLYDKRFMKLKFSEAQYKYLLLRLKEMGFPNRQKVFPGSAILRALDPESHKYFGDSDINEIRENKKNKINIDLNEDKNPNFSGHEPSKRRYIS